MTTMRGALLLFLVSTCFQLCAAQIPNNRELRCAACESTVKAIIKELRKVDPKAKIQIGGRIDGTTGGGVGGRKFVPLARSEVKLTEIMDDLCKASLPEVQAFVLSKKSKEWRFVGAKLMAQSDRWEKNFSYNAQSKLKSMCESLVEDHEDRLIGYITKNNDVSLEDLDLRNKVCVKMAKWCKKVKKKKTGPPTPYEQPKIHRPDL